MPRKRKARSYTATDHEHREMRARLPKTVRGETIDTLTRLIIYAVLRLPKSRRFPKKK